MEEPVYMCGIIPCKYGYIYMGVSGKCLYIVFNNNLCIVVSIMDQEKTMGITGSIIDKLIGNRGEIRRYLERWCHRFDTVNREKCVREMTR